MVKRVLPPLEMFWYYISSGAEDVWTSGNVYISLWRSSCRASLPGVPGSWQTAWVIYWAHLITKSIFVTKLDTFFFFILGKILRGKKISACTRKTYVSNLLYWIKPVGQLIQFNIVYSLQEAYSKTMIAQRCFAFTQQHYLLKLLQRCNEVQSISIG